MTDRGVDDPNNWHIKDGHSGDDIDNIVPLSDRMMSMYARAADKDFLAIRPLNIFSLAFAVEGLEDHISQHF